MLRSLIAIIVAALLASSASRAAAQAPGPAGTLTGFHLLEATIGDVQAELKSGRLTCRALVDFYLNRIEAYDKNVPQLNAVQTVNPHARSEAERLDAALRSSGPVGPMHCVPILLKDEVETSDMPTTYGSLVFKDFVPKRDATIVTKLKQAGAVIVGKTNMGEFASRYVGSAFGVTRNPYDPRRNPSGSSGGTGAGIAANYATVGIGEDTGGSIRGPASVASLVGLRPSVPLVSRFGMMPANPSQDTLGPIARTVKDAAILLDAIAGYDPNDSVTAYNVSQIPPTYTAFLKTDGLRGARLGIIREPMDPKADPTSEDYKKVRTVIENAPVKTLREILMSGKVVPWRAGLLYETVGRSTDQPGYLQVLAAREETRQLVLKIMADNRLDALVYATFDHQPTLIAPDVLTNLDTKDKDEYARGNNRYLSPSLAFPALTVPAGFTTDELPVGIEFMGRIFSEPTLFKLGYAYEQGTRNRKAPASTPALPGEP
jgi:amidase